MDIRREIRSNNYGLLRALLDNQLINLRENYDSELIESNNPQMFDHFEKKGYRTFTNTSLLDGIKGEKIAIHIMKTHIRRSIPACELLRLACVYSDTFFTEEFVDMCDEPDFKALQSLTDSPEILKLLSERKEDTRCCFFRR